MSARLFEFERNPNPTSASVRETMLADPGFGRYMTDHMVSIRWTDDLGWHDPRVSAYEPIALDPATSFLHYGQAIFEGLKAYRHNSTTVATFRAERNAERFRQSARRLAMAELPDDLFLGSIEALLEVDADWVPPGPERTLYLRPFMFGTEVALGVKPSSSYTYLLIASPAGPYFPQGIKPVSVWLCEDYVRAAPGGTGEAKCAGNYAASLVAQAEASRQGCDQVVWLDAAEHQWVEEMGGMNLFFVFGHGSEARLVTPALSGALLPGITRESLITLAESSGLAVAEEPISVQQWRQGCESGELTEVFACGTAAVITPVGQVKSAHGDWLVGDGTAGPVTMGLREQLVDLQTGAVDDPYGWVQRYARG